MIDKPNSSNTLGLELEGKNLKAAVLSAFKGRPKLDLLFEMDIEQKAELINEPPLCFSDVKPLYIEKKEGSKNVSPPHTLKNLIEKNLVSTCLNGNQVLTRNFEIKLKKERDIDAVLPFQVEPILPYSSDASLIDKIKIDQTVDGTFLTIFAAKKEHVKKHIEEWAPIQIEPEVISSESLALTAFSNHFLPSKTNHFIIYFKEGNVTCALVKNKKLVASQTIASKNKEPELNEVIRVLYSLSKQVKSIEVQDVLLLGSNSNFAALTKMLSKINKNVCHLETDPNFNLDERELKKFAVSIGLALNTLSLNTFSNQADSINFRQQELSFPDPLKHLKKPFQIFIALSFTLSVIFYFFGEAYLGNYEDSIKKEYLNLLSGMNKSYHIFENEYLAKFPETAAENGEIADILTLSQDEINERLKFLTKELQGTPDMFPLFPNVPRVSDVLAFLGTHPNITKKDPLTGENEPLIQLESFTYTMLKRPDKTKKQEKYQVKVEFEFNTATPKFAREFHDALIAPNSIVDPKGEIKWSSNRGKYKTSFFLKDKTIYPGNRI